VTHGFLYDSRSGSFTTIYVPGSTFTIAYGINNLGQIVGYFGVPSPGNNIAHGFIYEGGNFTTIDDPDAKYFTVVSGINDQGQIVGSFALAQQYGGLNAAAAALDFPNVQALQNAILEFCGG
jgi:probable HAF family extracellular repeat protein